MFSDIFETVEDFVQEHGIVILTIIVGFYLLHRIAKVFIEKAILRAISSDKLLSRDAEQRRRERTLVGIVEAVMDLVLVVIAAAMILSEIGIDTAALLAGFGVAGIAVGFGAQFLVKDLIAGIFVLLENQYRVGDVVCFDDTCGGVESISLRMTMLRDLDGTVHHVPNGEVRIASNLTKFHANVNIDIGVAYSSDLEHVISVINQVGLELREDEEWKEKIRTPPSFLRVDAFGDSAIMIKILGETVALEQWAVAGEFRKRLKIAFDREGIEIPFPQRVLHITPDRIPN